MNGRSIRTNVIISCLIVFLSAFYALPNLYPNLPVISVDAQKIDTNRIDNLLSEVSFKWIDELTIGFDLIEDQMSALKALQSAGLDDHRFSLNLQSTAPKWLTKIASPMKKGLDLQGGVHFLLKVDPSFSGTQQTGAKVIEVENILMDNDIRFRDIQYNENKFTLELDNSEDTTAATSALASISNSIQINGKQLVWSEQAAEKDALLSYAVEQTIDSLEKRVNELGISEVQIARQGQHHISIDMPGVQDIAYAKKIIGKTATLSFHLLADPSQHHIKHVADEYGQNIALQSDSILSGSSIIYASAQMDQLAPVVSIKLDGQAYNFYQATAQNIGQPLAVVYSESKKVGDETQVFEKVISAPVIRQPLHDQFVIQGVGTLESANDLALILRSGALAAPVEFVEEITIGPSMGEENIVNGMLALIVGTAMISLFMVLYYGMLGMIANIALCLNIIMTVAGLSILGATLTLPGIAGLVLSVGMAVDANVLINERIREESNGSSSLISIVKKGYDKALTAIIDANVTTILVTLVLFYMGSGAIKGFAVTTCVGIIASMFSAVYFTKNLSIFFVESGWIKSIHFSNQWFSPRKSLNFMGRKHLAFLFSSVIFLFSIVTITTQGINYGLDFTGGSQIILASKDSPSSELVRHKLKELSIDGAQVQTYGSNDVFMIKIPSSEEINQETIHLIESSIPSSHIVQTAFIGPQVGAEMFTNGVIALVAALCISLVYVAVRFEYRFAFSAIVSLIHDPILILGIFSYFQVEFDLISLAAMLTIIGYSINDTIVVYDRVRETLQNSSESTSSAVNKAINQTLSRTILTSGLTLAAVTSIYTFGGDYLKGFSLALSIGILVGTYSSIYIAGSLAVLMGLQKEDLLPSPNGVTT